MPLFRRQDRDNVSETSVEQGPLLKQKEEVWMIITLLSLHLLMFCNQIRFNDFVEANFEFQKKQREYWKELEQYRQAYPELSAMIGNIEKIWNKVLDTITEMSTHPQMRQDDQAVLKVIRYLQQFSDNLLEQVPEKYRTQGHIPLK